MARFCLISTAALLAILPKAAHGFVFDTHGRESQQLPQFQSLLDRGVSQFLQQQQLPQIQSFSEQGGRQPLQRQPLLQLQSFPEQSGSQLLQGQPLPQLQSSPDKGRSQLLQQQLLQQQLLQRQQPQQLPQQLPQQQQFLAPLSQQMLNPTSLLGSSIQSSSAQNPYAQNLAGMLQQTQSSLQSADTPAFSGSPPQTGYQQASADQDSNSLLQQLGGPLISSASMWESPQLPTAAVNSYASSAVASLHQSAIASLQAQLASEREQEVKLANMAAEKEDEMNRMNKSFAHISVLAEVSADQERQLQQELANSTAVNEALRIELAKIKDDDTKKARELFDEQAKVTELEQKIRQAEDVKGQALHVMQDVRLAQEKVQRTEDILRSLVPALSQRVPTQQMQQPASVFPQGAPPQQMQQPVSVFTEGVPTQQMQQPAYLVPDGFGR